MSKRDALRELSRRFPVADEVASFMGEVEKKGDREVAIMGGALLEACFERALKRSFQDLDPSLVGRVFQNRGPLADLDSKILIAQAFGIINGRFAGEMHIVRVVRNVFAHAIIDVSFETEEIKSKLLESQLAESFFSMLSSKSFADRELERQFQAMYKDASGRDRFVFLIRSGCSVLGF